MQGIGRMLVQGFLDAAVFERLLDGEIGVDAARENAGLGQMHETVHEHFAGAIQPTRKPIHTADARAQTVRTGGVRTKRGQGIAIVRVVALAQQQRMYQRIGQGANADLQGAAVAHQGARVQADRIFGRIDRLAWQREQGVTAGLIEQQRAEESRIDLRFVADEGQVRMHDADHEWPRDTGGLHLLDQVDGDVRVAGQAVAHLPCLFARGDQLHDHIYPAFDQIACDVGVIQACIVTLRRGDTEHRAGLQIELADAHVRRQRAGMLSCDIGQIGIVRAEMPGEERFEKTPLQIGLGFGPGQRQRGIQIQAQRRIARHAPIDRVEQNVRLAQTQRRGHAQFSAGHGENALDAGVDAGNPFGAGVHCDNLLTHRAHHRRSAWPRSHRHCAPEPSPRSQGLL